MVSYESFYSGGDYGLDSDYGNFTGYRVPVSEIGYPSDPMSANQLKKVSDKISTGAKTIEVSTVNIMGGGPMGIMDKIPKQQFEEINRLKKITGVDLTLHGPLVEPTGIGQGNWSELAREHAETELKSSVERAHKLDPDGNIIVVFHTSNGLPEPETRVMTPDGKEISRSLAVIDERTGQFGALPESKKDFFGGKSLNPLEGLDEMNKRNWSNSLSEISIGANRSQEVLASVTKKDNNLLALYSELKNNPLEFQKDIEKLDNATKERYSEVMNGIDYAKIHAQNSYNGLKESFNRAYEHAQKYGHDGVKKRLNNYIKEIAPKIEKWADDPLKLKEFTEEISKGLRLLDTLPSSSIPGFRPIKDFAIDKASETFSNVALNSYKKFGESSPILSLENPPVGMGLARGSEIKELVKETRNKFVNKLVDSGKSKSEAKRQAEKLIGVTWDLGHINMLRKYGYDNKALVKETKKIAPYIKHVHLSDNFGLDHTELPMGMGNVPTKQHLELIDKYNKKVKKIVETGDWFSKQGGLGLTHTPVLESMEAVGSPVYSMDMGPYWNQAKETYGSYFSGLGSVNPQVHHSLYGAGFSNLPPELGGQMEGQSRLSGSPMN